MTRLFFLREKSKQYFGYLFLLIFPFLLEASFRKFFLNYFKSDFLRKEGELVCNKGLAFGLDFNFNLIIFSNSFILIALTFWVSKSKDLGIKKYLLFLLLGAAFSNFIDRVRLGCVIDYIDLGFWPVFNISDTLIVISLILLFVFYHKRQP